MVAYSWLRSFWLTGPLGELVGITSNCLFLEYATGALGKNWWVGIKSWQLLIIESRNSLNCAGFWLIGVVMFWEFLTSTLAFWLFSFNNQNRFWFDVLNSIVFWNRITTPAGSVGNFFHLPGPLTNIINRRVFDYLSIFTTFLTKEEALLYRIFTHLSTWLQFSWITTALYLSRLVSSGTFIRYVFCSIYRIVKFYVRYLREGTVENGWSFQTFEELIQHPLTLV